MNLKNIRVCIVGLGYVGLPLALEFSKKFKTIGYDTNKEKIKFLKLGIDKNGEFHKKNLKKSKLIFSHNKNEIKNYNVFIITVPSPIYKNKKPNLELIKSASKTIASILKKNDFVIYESTVYPGATEEVFIPILEKKSNLKLNKDFFCGYSPERINPGDKRRKIYNIIKVTSGSNLYASKIIDRLYKTIIKAGTHKAESIKIAEAAKIIENTQRDVNIALMNELSLIFSKMKIDTNKVLSAAKTKWNFLDFKPGLVGGHCIGVDPYYLAYKSQKLKFKPKIITNGRSINDAMHNFVYLDIKKKINESNINFSKLKIIFFGVTFKPNCADIRNSRVFNLIDKFTNTSHTINIYDPEANFDNIDKFYKKMIVNEILHNKYDVGILAVHHNIFLKKIFKNKILKSLKQKNLLYDIKNSLIHN